MKADQLRALQAPLKEQYKEDPNSANWTLRAEGSIRQDGLICSVDAGFGIAHAGLHPATGGDGSAECSGDMLLQSLVACAGVTLASVATALEIDLKGGVVQAEGDLDFKGTLGVDRDAPVGFKEIRVKFDLETDAPDDKLATLLRLTERYCVVFQTLANAPKLAAEIASA